MALTKRLLRVEKEAAPGEKPRGIETHLRNMIIGPEMIRSIVCVYNGKVFCGVETKPEMVGVCLGEFARTSLRGTDVLECLLPTRRGSFLCT